MNTCQRDEERQPAGAPEGLVVYDRSTVTEPRFAERRDAWSFLQQAGGERCHGVSHRTFDHPGIEFRANPLEPDHVLYRDQVGMFEPNGPVINFNYRLERTSSDEQAEVDCGRLDWADWDHEGSLLLAREGCLYRSRAKDWFAGEPRLDLVADLRHQTFENIAPPEHAMQWPRLESRRRTKRRRR